jgi:large-conductance mechanosensitive channel
MESETTEMNDMSDGNKTEKVEQVVTLKVGGFIGTAIYLAIGALCFTLFSSSGALAWGNAWAWVWVALWPFCLAYYFFIFFAIAAVIIFVIWLFCDQFETRKRHKRWAERAKNRQNNLTRR